MSGAPALWLQIAPKCCLAQVCPPDWWVTKRVVQGDTRSQLGSVTVVPCTNLQVKYEITVSRQMSGKLCWLSNFVVSSTGRCPGTLTFPEQGTVTVAVSIGGNSQTLDTQTFDIVLDQEITVSNCVPLNPNLCSGIFTITIEANGVCDGLAGIAATAQCCNLQVQGQCTEVCRNLDDVVRCIEGSVVVGQPIIVGASGQTRGGALDTYITNSVGQARYPIPICPEDFACSFEEGCAEIVITLQANIDAPDDGSCVCTTLNTATLTPVGAVCGTSTSSVVMAVTCVPLAVTCSVSTNCTNSFCICEGSTVTPAVVKCPVITSPATIDYTVEINNTTTNCQVCINFTIGTANSGDTSPDYVKVPNFFGYEIHALDGVGTDLGVLITGPATFGQSVTIPCIAQTNLPVGAASIEVVATYPVGTLDSSAVPPIFSSVAGSGSCSFGCTQPIDFNAVNVPLTLQDCLTIVCSTSQPDCTCGPCAVSVIPTGPQCIQDLVTSLFGGSSPISVPTPGIDPVCGPLVTLTPVQQQCLFGTSPNPITFTLQFSSTCCGCCLTVINTVTLSAGSPDGVGCESGQPDQYEVSGFTAYDAVKFSDCCDVPPVRKLIPNARAIPVKKRAIFGLGSRISKR